MSVPFIQKINVLKSLLKSESDEEFDSFQGQGIIGELETTAAAATGTGEGGDLPLPKDAPLTEDDEEIKIDEKIPADPLTKDGEPIIDDDEGESKEGEGKGKPSEGEGKDKSSDGPTPCLQKYKIGDRVRILKTGEIGIVTKINSDCTHVITPIKNPSVNSSFDEGGETESQDNTQTYSYDDLEPAPMSIEDMREQMIEELDEIMNYQFKFLRYTASLSFSAAGLDMIKDAYAFYRIRNYRHLSSNAIFYSYNYHYLKLRDENKAKFIEIDVSRYVKTHEEIYLLFSIYHEDFFNNDFRIEQFSKLQIVRIIGYELTNDGDLFPYQLPLLEPLRKLKDEYIIPKNVMSDDDLINLYLLIRKIYDWFKNMQVYDAQYYRLLGLVSVMEPDLFDLDKFMFKNIDMYLSIMNTSDIILNNITILHQQDVSPSQYETLFNDLVKGRKLLIPYVESAPLNACIIYIYKSGGAYHATIYSEVYSLKDEYPDGYVKKVTLSNLDNIGEFLRRSIFLEGNDVYPFYFYSLYDFHFVIKSLFEEEKQKNWIENTEMLDAYMRQPPKLFLRELDYLTYRYL